MKFTQDQIQDIFKNYKKRKLPQQKSKRGEIKESLSRETLDNLYNTLNNSLQDIANEYNCTRQMVKYLMDEYGIERRGRGVARVLAIKKGKFDRFDYYDINEHFFSHWTPQMAWVLGLLFTDGNIQYSSRVSLCSIDLDLLEKVNEHLESSRPIIKAKQSYDKSKHIYHLEFYREKMREDLYKLGLVERKSLIMKFPNIPDVYIRHFIRGCWDGDGSIHMDGNVLTASFVCGSKLFIKSLVEKLYRADIYQCKLIRAKTKVERNCSGKNKVRVRSHNELKTIEQSQKNHLKFLMRMKDKYPNSKYPLSIHTSYSSKSPNYSIKLRGDNLKRLFRYFYDGVDESMYLTRKHKVLIKGLGV